MTDRDGSAFNGYSATVSLYQGGRLVVSKDLVNPDLVTTAPSGGGPALGVPFPHFALGGYDDVMDKVVASAANLAKLAWDALFGNSKNLVSPPHHVVAGMGFGYYYKLLAGYLHEYDHSSSSCVPQGFFTAWGKVFDLNTAQSNAYEAWQKDYDKLEKDMTKLQGQLLVEIKDLIVASSMLTIQLMTGEAELAEGEEAAVVLKVALGANAVKALVAAMSEVSSSEKVITDYMNGFASGRLTWDQFAGDIVSWAHNMTSVYTSGMKILQLLGKVAAGDAPEFPALKVISKWNGIFGVVQQTAKIIASLVSVGSQIFDLVPSIKQAHQLYVAAWDKFLASWHDFLGSYGTWLGSGPFHNCRSNKGDLVPPPQDFPSPVLMTKPSCDWNDTGSGGGSTLLVQRRARHRRQNATPGALALVGPG